MDLYSRCGDSHGIELCSELIGSSGEKEEAVVTRQQESLEAGLPGFPNRASLAVCRYHSVYTLWDTWTQPWSSASLWLSPNSSLGPAVCMLFPLTSPAVLLNLKNLED